MIEIAAAGLLLLAVAVVTRICKACWAKTEHYVIDSYDEEVIVKCSECGFSYREKKHD